MLARCCQVMWGAILLQATFYLLDFDYPRSKEIGSYIVQHFVSQEFA